MTTETNTTKLFFGVPNDEADLDSFFRILMEKQPSAVFLINEKAEIVFANHKACDILGYSQEELCRKTIIEVSKNRNFLDWGHHWEEIKVKGNMKVYPVHVHKSGREVPVEANASYFAIGGRELIYSFVSDISHKLETENALKETRNYYKLLSENITDVIWVMDLETQKFTYVSPSALKITGYSPEEYMVMDLNEILSEDSKLRVTELIKERVENYFKGHRGDFVDELIQLSKDRTEIFSEIHTRIIENPDTGKLEAIGVTSDIRNRKKIEQELIEKNKSLKDMSETKDKFLSIVSHDLRGPIHSFVSLSEMLSKELYELPFKDLAGGLRKMNQSAQNIALLLENLLNWSKLQQGKLVVVQKDLDLKQFVDETISLLTEMSFQKGVVMENLLTQELKAHVDEKMLQTILRNLIGNALKFSNKGARVRISGLINEKGMVQVNIADEGIGMNEQQVANLFTQAKAHALSGTAGEPSSGLGLVLCYEFLELNRGSVWVESKPGTGSMFCFELPPAQVK